MPYATVRGAWGTRALATGLGWRPSSRRCRAPTDASRSRPRSRPRSRSRSREHRPFRLAGASGNHERMPPELREASCPVSTNRVAVSPEDGDGAGGLGKRDRTLSGLHRKPCVQLETLNCRRPNIPIWVLAAPAFERPGPLLPSLTRKPERAFAVQRHDRRQEASGAALPPVSGECRTLPTQRLRTRSHANPRPPSVLRRLPTMTRSSASPARVGLRFPAPAEDLPSLAVGTLPATSPSARASADAPGLSSSMPAQRAEPGQATRRLERVRWRSVH